MSNLNIERVVEIFDENGLGTALSKQKIDGRKLLRILSNFRAVRFDLGLPCHGQRTQTNARTAKSSRKGVRKVINPFRKKIIRRSQLFHGFNHHGKRKKAKII